MSFDIECNSSHGDFPAAKKGYTRLANELRDAIKTFVHQGDREYETKKYIRRALYHAIGIEKSDAEFVNNNIISRLILKNPSSISPTNTINDLFIDDIYTCLVKKTSTMNAVDLLNKRLPPLCGDEVIQIGSTFGIYGQAINDVDPRARHVFVLGSCSNVTGVTVHRCVSEVALLLSWAKFVSNVDPDIMMGYNITGFDMTYLYDRAEETGCLELFCSLLSRLFNTPASYRTIILCTWGH